jgi:hypothetical protein
MSTLEPKAGSGLQIGGRHRRQTGEFAFGIAVLVPQILFPVAARCHRIVPAVF